MGFYGDRIVPRIVNRTCGSADLEPWRRKVCAGLSGAVIELGFGSGLNVPAYPSAVTSVTAIEPSDVGWRLAAERVASAPFKVERTELDAFVPNDTFDGALSTFTLCTVRNVDSVLGGIRRVLRPGGFLHFLEHGRAPDEPVRRWQRRLDPIQKAMAGGCHLTRPIADLITGAGFTNVEAEEFYMPRTPRVAGAFTIGRAQK